MLQVIIRAIPRESYRKLRTNTISNLEYINNTVYDRKGKDGDIYDLFVIHISMQTRPKT